jgi:ADP-heptose:LPS heptosyltransferase
VSKKTGTAIVLQTLYYERMRKTKFFGSYKSFLSSFLPAGAVVSLLRWNVERKYRAPQLVFPYECGPSPRFLVILPDTPLAALHQLSCLVSLAAHFKGAHLAVLCEKRVTPFFKTVAGIAEFIEYDAAEQYLFSREFDRIGKEISAARYDVCVMLSQDPQLALLYAAGQTAAQVRIGLKGAGDYPFLNLHVNPAPERTNLTDRSLLVAAMLGVPVRPKARWSVAKESVEEVGLMLREMNVSPSSRLIGIDGAHFFSRHGRQWTQSLVDMLQKKSFMCYLFSYDEPEVDAAQWAGQQKLPLFSNLPATRGAALIYKSVFVVAGPTVLFELADLMRTPVAGVFADEEFGMFCRESDTTKGLRYAKRPDEATIGSIERCVDAIAAKPALVP